MNIATKLLTRVLFLTILPVTSAVLPFQSVTAQEKLQTVHIHSAEDLHEFFRYTGNDIPLVSGHRGGIVEGYRSEEHTSELQSRGHLVCRLLLEKKKHT